MNAKKDNTEDKILDAAQDVFIKKGMDGARMQEIADEAGINKALLHYYFRSKEKLFDAIFGRLIGLAFPRIGRVLQEDIPFVEKVEHVVDTYMDLLLKHPYLPAFIIKEMNRDRSLFFKLIEKYGFNLEFLFAIVQDAMDCNEIVRMKPEHLLVNVIGLCVFPFTVKPVISHVAFDDDKKATQAFYEERRVEIKRFVIRAIQA